MPDYTNTLLYYAAVGPALQPPRANAGRVGGAERDQLQRRDHYESAIGKY